MKYFSAFLLLCFFLAACGVPGTGPVTSEPPTVAPPTEPAVPALTSEATESLPSSTEPQDTKAVHLPTETPDPSVTAMPTESSTPNSPVIIPNPVLYEWQPIITDLSSPVGIANAGDGSDRLFIIEQEGIIRIWQQGTLVPGPFLDIQERIGSSGSEQGLLGLAFHPDYQVNGLLFINYTDLDGDTIIARFQVSMNNPDEVNPSSELQLLTVGQPYGNHNGGALAFGPDGYLYIGLGDGGSGGDPLNNAQSLDTLLGKILRIDVENGEPYGIPQDNPFIGSPWPEIWSYGLRNPWRFSFDRLTGDLYIGDVGQNRWEEIDYLPSTAPGGTNFGWRYFEASQNFEGTPPAAVDFVDPISEYAHDQGCSVTGGVVYRGQELPEWNGVYLYGDYCTGKIWGLTQNTDMTWNTTAVFENVGRISSFGEDEAGEVYLADHTGTIYKLAAK